MDFVTVEISRYVDNSQPGWVECRLVDALGCEHVFVEKVPVVSTALLDDTTTYPQIGHIACTALARRMREDGRELVQIDTQTPFVIESTAGKSRFDVFPEQLDYFNPN